MTERDPHEAKPDAASEAGESETLAESPTPQPPPDAGPDTAAAGAEAGPPQPVRAEVVSDATDVEAAVEEVPPTPPRAARAPAWAWVVITLMALLLASGLATLAVLRNANPSTPEAVEDAKTLVAELETLNDSLATTNEILANAIAASQQLSATAQAKLAGLSSLLGDAGARVGQARSLLSSQLPDTTRSGLDDAQQQIQAQRRTLAQRRERLALQIDQQVNQRAGEIGGRSEQRTDEHGARIEVLEGRQADTEARLQAEADRLRGEAAQLRATLEAQREQGQALVAQLRQLRRSVAVLRRIVDRLSSRR